MSTNSGRPLCPTCGVALSDADFARFGYQAHRVRYGTFRFQSPEEWWHLSCGHRVETLIDRWGDNPEVIRYKLVPR